jgi:maltose phosphorylase
MAKVATRYLQIDPWVVREKGFHPGRSRVSESIFSLGNEFMGVRGYFEEGCSGDSLVGSYFNGVFEEQPIGHPALFKGLAVRNHFMVNSVDWLYTRVTLDGETLNLGEARIRGFERTLDMRTGTLTRSFVWRTKTGRKARLRFTRFTSMARANLGCQRIEIEPLGFSGKVRVKLGLDFSPLHEARGVNFWRCPLKGRRGAVTAILGETLASRQKVFSGFQWQSSVKPTRTRKLDELPGSAKSIGVELDLGLTSGEATVLDRIVVNHVERRPGVAPKEVWRKGLALAAKLSDTAFDEALDDHAAYWHDVWERFDIAIDGDPENEQGTRFCIFQMHQTYHGVDASLNVGAKGLTGEVYDGATFWDTETYCLPFYLFNNPKAARNLLLYRYRTLPQAKARARELDCVGARYPMSTIDGSESCGVWQHGDLEIHVSAAVSYGIWHYVRVTDDRDFLYRYGLEMLIEISRFFASHGDWSPKTGEFGLWGVMGADEFHMMVHNNAYTNVMAKKTFEWTLGAMSEMKKKAPKQLRQVMRKVKLGAAEPATWKRMARKMRVLRDPKTGLIEQHDGYFDMPRLDVKAIPPDMFPLYKSMAYIRIFRYDMLKQPDALLLHFFFSHGYSLAEKRVNFEFYEPRTIHESSLSPGIHSILAAELGLHRKAFDYVKHASRLDLDDYNRNTHEGLHTTSMAAAWMSLVYGFGGMRSDGETISFNPSIPAKWKAFSFRVLCRGALLEVRVDRKRVAFKAVDGPAVAVEVFGKRTKVGPRAVEVVMPKGRVG